MSMWLMPHPHELMLAKPDGKQRYPPGKLCCHCGHFIWSPQNTLWMKQGRKRCLLGCDIFRGLHGDSAAGPTRLYSRGTPVSDPGPSRQTYQRPSAPGGCSCSWKSCKPNTPEQVLLPVPCPPGDHRPPSVKPATECRLGAGFLAAWSNVFLKTA